MAPEKTPYDKEADEQPFHHSLPAEDRPAGLAGGPSESPPPKAPSVDNGAESAEDIKRSEQSGGKEGGFYSGAKGKAGDKATEEAAQIAAQFAGLGTASKIAFKAAQFFTGPNKKRNVIASSGTAFVIVVGIIAVMSIFTGPLEFVHMAQMLEKFHMSDMQDVEDGRLTKMARYVRDPNSPQNTRMGKHANKFTDKFEEKMKKSGLESAYTENFGFYDGYTVDMNNERFKDMSTNEVKKELVELYGLDEGDIHPSASSNGKQTLKIDSKNLSYRKQVKLNRAILRDAGYSKLTANIGARMMGKRAGVTWHPIRRADQKILEGGAAKLKALKEQWRQEQVKTITEGSGPISAKPSQDPEKDKNGDVVPESADNAEKVQAEIDDTNSAASDAHQATVDGDAGATTKFQDKLSVKITAGGAALAGVACMVRAMSENISSLRMEQAIIPMMRMGVQVLSLGSQVMSNDDISLQQLGFFKEKLHEVNADGKNISDANQAKSIQAESGETQNGPDVPDSARVVGEGNPFDILDNVPGIDAVCSAFNSTAGQILQFALGGGPLSAAFSLATQPLVEKVLGAAASWLAGTPVNPLASGAEFGNLANWGVRLAANDQAAGAGGKALSKDEEQELASAGNAARKEEFNNKSFAHRVFSPVDHQSLFAKVIDNQQASGTKNVANMMSSFSSVFASALRSPATLLTQKANAAENTYDYGFPEIGFSAADQNAPEVENPYKNAAKAAELLKGDNGDNYIEMASKCFGVDITGVDEDDINVTSGDGVTDLYGNDYPSECNDTSEDWRTIRFFILDTETMNSYACFEGDDTACTDVDATAVQEGTDSSSTTEDDAVSGELIKLKHPLSTPGGKIDPKGITLHWWGSTSGGQGIDALVSALRSNTTCGAGGCSVQIGITADGKAYQMTKNLTDLTYHAIGGNSTTFGIEIEGGPEQFGKAGIEKYPKKFEAVVAVVKYLMKEYDIPANGPVVCDNVVGVHSHKDYNSCTSIQKDDIDDYYFNEVMKRVKE